MLTEIALPVFELCGRSGDVGIASGLERVVYEKLIRRFEDPTHQEACFDLFEDVMYGLGVQAVSDDIAPLESSSSVKRLLFFVHNFSGDLANVVLLCDLLDAYFAACPQDIRNVGIVGVAFPTPSPRVSELQRKWGLNVWPLQPNKRTCDAYLEAGQVLAREGFDRLVFTGVPFGLSFASGLLGPARLAWLSMKFELACFKHLHIRCSFATGARRTRVVAGRTWHEAPPLFTEQVELRASGASIPALAAARRFGTVFYTVNREEKIRNPDFIDMVARILEQVPDSSFVWTGRAAPPDVTERLAARGLDQRHFFAGWVSPDDLVVGGDIFLDTPVLSGIIAARATAAGRPVVTMADSRSWVGVFQPSYAEECSRGSGAELSRRISALQERGVWLECTSKEQYISQAVLLARSPELRNEFGAALGAFAHRYFFNAQRSAVEHLANLRM